MAEQYTSLKVIYDSLTRQRLLANLSFEAVIDYTVEFMQILGIPGLFINKVTTLSTDNYKIKLPCDYLKLVQMKGRYGTYRKGTSTFHMKPKHHHHHDFCGNGCVVSRCDTPRIEGESCTHCEFQNTCAEYHFDYNKTECICMLRTHVVPSRPRNGNYYVIQNSYIYLSNRVDTVDISYYAFLTDDEGYPLIPDNAAFRRALKAYIKSEFFTEKFDNGEIDIRILQQAQQAYAWAVGACESDMQMSNLGDLEAFSDTAHGIINKNNEWDNHFASNADPLIFKTH
jgi:hypothetical protein